MSTVYIIKDGIIVDKEIATSSYRDHRGDTVKPKNGREEWELNRFSENSVKIKELKEEIEALKEKENAPCAEIDLEYAGYVEEMFESLSRLAHQRFCPGELQKLAEEWKGTKAVMDRAGAKEAAAAQASLILRKGGVLRREILRKEMEWTDNFNHVIETLKTLRRNAEKLEELMFCVSTEDGMEEIDAEVNERTLGELKKIQRRLDEISDRLSEKELNDLGELQKLLEEIDKKLQELPEKAKEVFTAQVWRQEQVRNVYDRLKASGWKVEKVLEGSGLFDDIYMMVQNVSGDKAEIIFSIEGDVQINSHFGEEQKELRRALQQTVLGVLVDGGAKGASGHCMDDAQDDEKGNFAEHSAGAAKKAAVEVSKTGKAVSSGAGKS